MKQHLIGIMDNQVKHEVQLLVLDHGINEQHTFALQVRVSGDIHDLEAQPVFQALPAMLQSQIRTAMENYDQFGLEAQVMNTVETEDET